MSRLYDRESKQWVDVPERDVTRLVQAGTHAFQTGIQIPVVAPDGTIGSITSDEAERAFRDDGYRWQTQEDIKQFEKAGNEAILDKQYNDSLRAFNQGAVRGLTFGTSDAIMQGMGALVGQEDAVKQGLMETKKRSPLAAAGGQIAGSLANPALVGAGKTVYGAGEAAGLKLAGGLAEAGAAAKIAKTIAPVAMGSAVEGAFYGLGDGISEAALGNPDEIAENLMAGPLNGAIFGGGFGAALGAGKLAATPLKAAISKAAEVGADLTGKGMRASARNALIPALSLKGEKELVEIVKDMTSEGSDVVRAAYYSGGKEAAQDAAREIKKLEEAAVKRAKSLKADVDYAITQYPKATRRQIQEDLAEYKGDISEALSGSYARYEGERARLTSALQLDQNPSEMIGAIRSDTTKLIDQLRNSGDPRAIRKAGSLEAFLDAQDAADAAWHAQGKMYRTEGRDMLLMQELRERGKNGFGKLNADGQKIVSKYLDNLTRSLKEHPTYGEDFAKLDGFYDAMDGLRSAATGVRKGTATEAKYSILDGIKNDPEKAAEFDKLVNNLADIAPEMEVFRTSGRNLAARQQALDAINDKLNRISDRAFGRLDVDDMEEAVKLFAGPGMLEKVDAIRNITQAMQMDGTGVISKAIRLQKELGKDVSAEWQKLAQYDGDFAKLNKIAPDRDEADYLKDLVTDVRNRAARAAVGGAVGYMAGDKAGGVAGTLAGLALGTRGSMTSSTLKALTMLERQANKSFRLIEDASKRAVDALTGDRARIVANVAGAQNYRPLSERRKDFKERSEYLTKLQDPAARVQAIEQRVGTLPGAPNLQSAASMQFSKVADFLISKLPTDPLAGRSMSSRASPWVPSDYELHKFERYVDAAENPASVLDKIARGTVSPEEVETLQVLYPTIYKRLQMGVVNAIMDPNTNLSYKQKINIGTVLNVPADVTLEPQFIASMQARISPQDQGGRPEGATDSKPRAPRALNIEQQMTNVERISNR